MNRNGTAILLVILISVIYFMVGMTIYQFIKPDISIARTSLECSAPDTSGDMLNCLIISGVVPMVVISILSGAGGYITERTLR